MSKDRQKLPPGLRWRGNTIWIDMTVDGQRIRESTKTADIKIARARKSKVESSLHEGTYHAPRKNGVRGEYTVSKAFDNAIGGTWLIDAADGSKVMARNHLKRLVDEEYLSNDTPVTALDAGFLRKLQRQLVDVGLANNTINGRLWVIQSLLRQAVTDGAIKTLPAFPKRLSNKDSRRKRYLTLPEEEQILTYLSAEDSSGNLRDLWVIALDTGMRHFEIVRLTAAQFNESRGRVEVPAGWSKNGDARSVPLTARVMEILKRRLEISEQVFPLPHDGQVHPRYWCFEFGRQWRKVRREMGLPEDLVVHTARHTAATRLFEVGMDVRTAQAFLGHRDASTTMTYAKLVDTRLDDAASRIESYVTKKESQR